MLTLYSAQTEKPIQNEENGESLIEIQTRVHLFSYYFPISIYYFAFILQQII